MSTSRATAASPRLHAVLEEVAGTWVLMDDGLSRHGSQVNGDPCAPAVASSHGDVITLGETPIVFLAPEDGAPSRTR